MRGGRQVAKIVALWAPRCPPGTPRWITGPTWTGYAWGPMSEADLDALDPTAFAVAEVLAELGSPLDPRTAARRILQIQTGKGAEAEFAVLLSWLGRCSLVHRLDQVQLPPDSKKTQKVPDLLAIFRYKGRDLPVLIEVKASKKRRLKWSSEYYQAMVAYAAQLRLPLLVAFNHTPVGLWALCDVSAFERQPTGSYVLNHETALRHTLLSELAGDFVYQFWDGVGMHLLLTKLEQSDVRPDGSKWLVRVDEASLTDGLGRCLKTLGPGAWWMFLGTEQDDETVDHPEHFSQSFVVRPDTSQMAHRLLPLVVGGLAKYGEPIQWRREMERHAFRIRGPRLADEARAAISRAVIKYVYTLRPAVLPRFLAEVT
jgi:Holliday junction resolvase